MNIHIKVLQVMSGDAIIVEYGKKNLIIDGGFLNATYKTSLRPQLLSIIKEETSIDLWILTHLDADHINGMVAYMRDNGISKRILKEVWFNCFDYFPIPEDINLTSLGKGIELRDLLRGNNILLNNDIKEEYVWEDGTLEIKVLTPGVNTYEVLRKVWEEEMRKFHKPQSDVLVYKKENDYAQSIEDLAQKDDWPEDGSDIANKSSISFILKAGDINMLFLGDAHAADVINGLKKLSIDEGKLKFDVVKLSHHGSKHNFRPELLDVIECNTFIISSNGDNTSCLPDKETLAKILLHKSRDITKTIKFVFNYDNPTIRSIFKSDIETEVAYNFKCIYPNNNERFVEIVF